MTETVRDLETTLQRLRARITARVSNGMYIITMRQDNVMTKYEAPTLIAALTKAMEQRC